MTVRIDMGLTASGTTATMDLEELLATRLLVQGNSGSGKSHLLRRLVEQSAPIVQQAIIDPEGDFVTLADLFGHVVVEASSHTEAAIQQIGARVRQHRISVVLNLEGLDAEMQMRHAAAFLGGMFDVDRDYWFPVLVVVDEAQMFAPAAAGEVSDEARKASLGAMTNLMCRGRKRGLAGVIATQRLAKLAKNVAAEASNFLMGRTFLDIDMARAADLLGMERKQAEMFRDLERGRFIALGPAMCRRPLPIRIGDVQTQARAVAPKLMPLPEMGDNARDLIMKPGENEVPKYNSRRPSRKRRRKHQRRMGKGPGHRRRTARRRPWRLPAAGPRGAGAGPLPVRRPHCAGHGQPLGPPRPQPAGLYRAARLHRLRRDDGRQPRHLDHTAGMGNRPRRPQRPRRRRIRRSGVTPHPTSSWPDLLRPSTALTSAGAIPTRVKPGDDVITARNTLLLRDLK